MELLYRGTKEGMTNVAFHNKCNNISTTLILFKCIKGYIFEDILIIIGEILINLNLLQIVLFSLYQIFIKLIPQTLIILIQDISFMMVLVMALLLEEALILIFLIMVIIIIALIFLILIKILWEKEDQFLQVI